jgi:hypothetical protein
LAEGTQADSASAVTRRGRAAFMGALCALGRGLVHA